MLITSSYLHNNSDILCLSPPAAKNTLIRPINNAKIFCVHGNNVILPFFIMPSYTCKVHIGLSYVKVIPLALIDTHSNSEMTLMHL